MKNPFKSRKVPPELAAWNETIQLAMNRPVNLKSISTLILKSIAHDSIENEIVKVLAITEKIGMESENRNIFVSTIRSLLQIDEERAISFAVENMESYGDERSTRSILPALIRSGDLQTAEMLIQTVDDDAYQQRILSDINEARKLTDPSHINKEEYYENIRKGELKNALHNAIQYYIYSPGSEAEHRLKYINSLLQSLNPDWRPELNSSNIMNGEVIPNKILHLHKVSYPFESTGGAIRNMDVIKSQKHVGLEPFVVTPLNYPRIFDIEDFPLSEEISGVRHLRIDLGSNNSKSMQYITANLQMNTEILAGIIRKERPALIHAASGYKGYELAVMAESLSRHFGIPWIYEVRSFHEHTWTNNPKYAMNSEHTRLRIEKENSLMKKAECVVTISESMKRAIIERGIEPDRITIVPNAVDRYRFKPLQRNETLQLELGLKDSFTLGYISNMSLREGHDILIKAIPNLIKEHGNVKLLLVGDGKERENLEKLVEELKIENRLIFTGNVDHSKIQEYYALIDLFVVPRRQDYASDLVTPLKPFEAMAMKIPLLVSDRPALLEIIGEDRGFSFRTEDSEHLAEMVSQFINNPNEAEIRVENAAKWISESRTWKHNAEKYLNMYVNLISNLDNNKLKEDSRRRYWESLSHPFHSLKNHYNKSAWERIDKGLLKVWSSFENFEFDDENIDWFANPFNNKTWELYFHGLNWLYSYLWSIDNLNNNPEKIYEILLHYCEFTDSEELPEMVWFDHATSDRLSLLVAIMLHPCSASMSTETRQRIDQFIIAHIQKILEFKKSEFWNNSNHGVFHALALINASTLIEKGPKNEDVKESGIEYLVASLNGIIDIEEAISLEQSSYYHQLAIELIEMIDEKYLNISGINKDDLIQRMCQTNHWLTISNENKLLAIGDTSSISRAALKHLPEKTPQEVLKTYEKAGISIVKNVQKNGINHFAMLHRSERGPHGHFDALSVTLSMNDCEFLIDSGGPFNYGDSMRYQYFMASRAHNVALINGKGHNEGAKFIESRTISKGIHLMSAEHSGYQPIVHKRDVVVIENSGMIVVDSFNGIDSLCTIELLWHLHPDCELDIDSRTIKNGDNSLSISTSIEGEYSIQSGILGDGVQGWCTEGIGKKKQIDTIVNKHSTDGDITIVSCFIDDSEVKVQINSCKISILTKDENVKFDFL